MAIEIVDFPIENGDFPIKNGGFPLKMVIFPLPMVIFHSYVFCMNSCNPGPDDTMRRCHVKFRHSFNLPAKSWPHRFPAPVHEAIHCIP